MKEKIIKRGEIYWIHLPSLTENKEDKNSQLGIIVSNNEQNSISYFVTVLPFILQSDQFCPFEVQIEFDQKKGKILTSQITTIEKKRLCEKAGQLSNESMNQVEQSLFSVLDLSKSNSIKIA